MKLIHLLLLLLLSFPINALSQKRFRGECLYIREVGYDSLWHLSLSDLGVEQQVGECDTIPYYSVTLHCHFPSSSRIFVVRLEKWGSYIEDVSDDMLFKDINPSVAAWLCRQVDLFFVKKQEALYNKPVPSETRSFAYPLEIEIEEEGGIRRIKDSLVPAPKDESITYSERFSQFLNAINRIADLYYAHDCTLIYN